MKLEYGAVSQGYPPASNPAIKRPIRSAKLFHRIRRENKHVDSVHTLGHTTFFFKETDASKLKNLLLDTSYPGTTTLF